MKNNLTKTILTAFIAVLLPMMPCDAARNPSNLVGRWVEVSKNYLFPQTMELLSDGTGIITKGSKGTGFGWKTENGRFYSHIFESQVANYKLQGSLLTFTDDKGKVIAEYTKCKKDCDEARKEYFKAKEASIIVEDLQIKIDKNSIYVESKKVANTVDVAKQDTLFIEALFEVLKNKKKSTLQIYTEPNIKYNVLYKVAATGFLCGFTDILFTTKTNGKYYTEKINLSLAGINFFDNSASDNVDNSASDNALNLTVGLAKNFIEIWARGGSLPKIFYKECKDSKGNTELCTLLRLSEDDPGTVQMSVYSKTDSAYLNIENAFISELSDVIPGKVVATLSERSSRKLACGQSAAGVEDICGSDGKPAISRKPRSAYDELAKTLIMIHNRFFDSPDANDIVVISDGDTEEVSKIILLLHRARTAGFTNIKLVCLQGV